MTVEVQTTSDAPAKVAQSLQYATPVARPPSVWAGLVLVLTGLGLIALGGCFLVGILSSYVPQVLVPSAPPSVWTPGLVFFVSILYVLALVCFGAALWILKTVIPRLFKLIQ